MNSIVEEDQRQRLAANAGKEKLKNPEVETSVDAHFSK
jgi:hypothetical protein